MCCLFKSRKTPACIVFVLSFLGVVAGIAMIYFAVKLNGSEFMDKISQVDDLTADYDMEAARKLIFYGLIVFALIAIIAALMGMVACKIKNRCYTICYGCILMPTWIIILIVGGLAVYASTEGKDQLMSQCKIAVDKLDAARNPSSSGGSSQADPCSIDYSSMNDFKVSLEVYETIMINKEMCSTNCPCKVGVSTADQWTTITPEDQKKVGRCTPFVFTGTYETYQQCLESPPVTASVGFRAFANELTVNNKGTYTIIADLLAFFESTYDCAGVCESALFYFSKSVKEGRPTGSCVGNIKDEINSEFGGLGAATLCSGVLLLCIFFMQYCLWYKY